MKWSEIKGNVITAVVTALIVGIVSWAVTSYRAGDEAIEKDRVEKIVADAIEAAMKTDDGQTYGKAISSISDDMTAVKTSVGHIEGDIGRIDETLGALIN